MTQDDLMALVAAAAARYDAMTPEQKRAADRAQRRSYVIGEMAMGDDGDEAAYAKALYEGDIEEVDRLDGQARARISAATKWLDENGL